MTLAFTDPIFSQHDTGLGHPEKMARHAAILRGLDAAGAEMRTAPAADWAPIKAVHPQSHINRLMAADTKAQDGSRISLDSDTHMMSASLTAALKAVGGALAGVDALMAGEAKHVYIACRPPGHHAEPDRAMGFCLLATIAIAARYAIQNYGLERVAILDPDVHHGNGTQAVFWNDPAVMFASSHQMPLYPGSGARTEVGAHNQIINMPLTEGAGSKGFRSAWEPSFDRLRSFDPQMIFVSAGYDAHRLDPLGGVGLSDDDFAWFGQQTRALADQTAGGKILSCQEGGYSLEALETAVAAYTQATDT